MLRLDDDRRALFFGSFAAGEKELINFVIARSAATKQSRLFVDAERRDWIASLRSQ
jgi:hypothetical protein